MLPTQLLEIFFKVLHTDGEVRRAAVADVVACYERVRAPAGGAQRGAGLVWGGGG